MFHLFLALLLLVVTNTAAWLSGYLIPANWRWPLDGGALFLDRQRILGDHKTWGGLIAGATMCGVFAALLQRSFLLGMAFGSLSLAGDCVSSFIKRRVRFNPGAEVPFLDQLPEALTPLLVLRCPLGLSMTEGIAIAAAFSFLDLASAKARRSQPQP